MIVTIPDAITAFRFIFPTQMIADSPTWTRTRNQVINSHLLCQLSYRGLIDSIYSTVFAISFIARRRLSLCPDSCRIIGLLESVKVHLHKLISEQYQRFILISIKLNDLPLFRASRDDRIRTYGPCFPKAVLYQTELHPVVGNTGFEPVTYCV